MYALEELVNYFNKLYEDDQKTYKERFDSFSKIVGAIANGDPIEIQLSINEAYRTYNKGNLSNRYAAYLKKLSNELNSVGIDELQKILKKLDIINFANVEKKDIELVAFDKVNLSKTQSSSPPKLRKSSFFSEALLWHRQIDFLRDEIDKLIKSLHSYVEKAEEKKSTVEKNMAAPNANTAVMTYLAEVAQQKIMTGIVSLGFINIELIKNKIAIAETLQSNLLELKLKKFKKISVDDLAVTVHTYLMIATKENQEFVDAASANKGELGEILDEAIKFLEKYYPESSSEARKLYAEYDAEYEASKKNKPSI